MAKLSRCDRGGEAQAKPAEGAVGWSEKLDG